MVDGPPVDGRGSAVAGCGPPLVLGLIAANASDGILVNSPIPLGRYCAPPLVVIGSQEKKGVFCPVPTFAAL